MVEHVIAHIGMSINLPLVLTFAGLSGHGKTELSRQMGLLLQAPTTVLDCAQMRSDIGLFGSRSGYQGNELGSQLNNHLAKYDGMRNVVFLHEFDKTEQEVRNSLLLLLDSGDYHDRRTNKPVDAAKTTCILATNLGDRAIAAFYEEYMANITEVEKTEVPHKVLQTQLKALFHDKFGPPMAGRMKNIVPFYPFDKAEQAVLCHNFPSDLADQLRKSIDISPMTKRYPGDVHLAIKNDGRLCKHLAEKSYIPELGARSLYSGIDEVRRNFFTTFVDPTDLISEELNDGPLMKYTVKMVLIAGTKAESEVILVGDGYAQYHRGQEDIPEDEEMMDSELEDLSGAFDKMLAVDRRVNSINPADEDGIL